MTEDIEYMEGKVISFGQVDDTLAVKDVKFKEILGRLFATGVIPEGTTKNDWAVGNSCAVAWDSVTDFIVFETVEDYVRSLEKADENRI